MEFNNLSPIYINIPSICHLRYDAASNHIKNISKENEDTTGSSRDTEVKRKSSSAKRCLCPLVLYKNIIVMWKELWIDPWAKFRRKRRRKSRWRWSAQSVRTGACCPSSDVSTSNSVETRRRRSVRTLSSTRFRFEEHNILMGILSFFREYRFSFRKEFGQKLRIAFYVCEECSLWFQNQ